LVATARLYHTECSTNFVLIRTVVHFGRKGSTLLCPTTALTTTGCTHHFAASSAPRCAENRAANLNPHRLRGGMQVAAPYVSWINGRILSGMEHPFVTCTKQAKPTNKLRML
jgi:hypothetical protein